jgi:hypothetical protein
VRAGLANAAIFAILSGGLICPLTGTVFRAGDVR